MSKEKVNEIEKGGKDSRLEFWVVLACEIRQKKEEKRKKEGKGINWKWNMKSEIKD